MTVRLKTYMLIACLAAAAAVCFMSGKALYAQSGDDALKTAVLSMSSNFMKTLQSACTNRTAQTRLRDMLMSDIDVRFKSETEINNATILLMQDKLSPYGLIKFITGYNIYRFMNLTPNDRGKVKYEIVSYELQRFNPEYNQDRVIEEQVSFDHFYFVRVNMRYKITQYDSGGTRVLSESVENIVSEIDLAPISNKYVVFGFIM